MAFALNNVNLTIVGDRGSIEQILQTFRSAYVCNNLDVQIAVVNPTTVAQWLYDQNLSDGFKEVRDMGGGVAFVKVD